MSRSVTITTPFLSPEEVASLLGRLPAEATGDRGDRWLGDDEHKAQARSRHNQESGRTGSEKEVGDIPSEPSGGPCQGQGLIATLFS